MLILPGRLKVSTPPIQEIPEIIPSVQSHCLWLEASPSVGDCGEQILNSHFFCIRLEVGSRILSHTIMTLGISHPLLFILRH